MLLQKQSKFQTTRVDEWDKAIRKMFGGLEIQVTDSSKFKAFLEVCEIADFNLIMVQSTPARVEHRGSIGAYSEQERYLVKTQFTGSSDIKFGADVVKLQPGDFVICDNARSYALEFTEETEILSIPIPSKVLGRFHAQPEELAFKRADRELAINQVLFSYVKSIWEARLTNSGDTHAKRLLAYYFDLLILGFENADETAVNISSTQYAHLERCKRYINEHLMEETLCPPSVAKALAISERYLFSIFSNAGLTVSGYIIAMRLDKAAQVLRSRRFETLTISEVAFNAGFKSAAHFSRVFKARFNESPTQYRKRTYV